MSNLSTAKPIHFASERDRRTYQTGLAQVAAKLAGHRKPTASQLEAATIAEGRAIIAKRFGREAFKCMFGCEPPRTMAAPARPAASGTPKHYAKEAGPFEPRKLHVYTCRQWLHALP